MFKGKRTQIACAAGVGLAGIRLTFGSALDPATWQLIDQAITYLVLYFFADRFSRDQIQRALAAMHNLWPLLLELIDAAKPKTPDRPTFGDSTRVPEPTGGGVAVAPAVPTPAVEHVTPSPAGYEPKA